MIEQTQLEKDLMPFAKAFLDGDPVAMGEVYSKTHGLLAARAHKNGVDVDECDDVASEAILYVQGRGSDKWNGKTILAPLCRTVDWLCLNLINRNRFIVQEDLPLALGDWDTKDEEPETPMTLEQLEGFRMMQGGEPHPIWKATELTTPEDIVLAENLRERLERFACEACGPRHWQIYADVTLYDMAQADAATKYGISQPRVSQICTEVAAAIKQKLLGS